MIAGTGAVTFGLSFFVSPSITAFLLGVPGLAFGGTVLVTESFGLSAPE
ncbi:hypothetical protein [Halapricum desulfuricans]|uniref:Uncharacterized protein n=1 Tax=Halapricum desulfuricans TaxID=2841257 RepID=A0A897NAZ6_9EURY|nr:hypothetical protein [Halapricum desulfuricans]QSG08159.1 hypothetical protein HSR122_0754 [Halapricum desulfuricans]